MIYRNFLSRILVFYLVAIIGVEAEPSNKMSEFFQLTLSDAIKAYPKVDNMEQKYRNLSIGYKASGSVSQPFPSRFLEQAFNCYTSTLRKL